VRTLAVIVSSSHSHTASVAALQDILDGYFPSEWRATYPQGVVLELRDETDKVFSPPAATVPAAAPSSAAEGGSRGSAASAIASLASLGGDDLALMPTQEFLSRLPARVVRGGHVLSLRDDLSAMLIGGGGAGGEADAAAVPGPAIVVADTPWAHGSSTTGGDGGSTAIATLQIKSGDGLQTLVVRLPATATVRELRDVIDAHRAHTTPYELRTAYPRKALDDIAATLTDAKLAPSSTLHLRVLPPVPVAT